MLRNYRADCNPPAAPARKNRFRSRGRPVVAPALVGAVDRWATPEETPIEAG
jgi:hypothetical protein